MHEVTRGFNVIAADDFTVRGAEYVVSCSPRSIRLVGSTAQRPSRPRFIRTNGRPVAEQQPGSLEATTTSTRKGDGHGFSR